jgi:3-phosphoshikimate 1-carboxyvinyltransferase
MRFVPPLAALADGPVAFDGDPRARERPMGPLLQALRDLGVRVDAATGDRLPFATLGTGRVAGGRVALDASGSSQFISALLLVGCRFDQGVEVAATTAVPSLPHVRMTVDLLRTAGIDVEEIDDRTWRVHPGVPHLGEIVVEPDLSNAMPFIVAALITGGTVRIPGWPAQSLQPAHEVSELIERLGGRLEHRDDGLHVHGESAPTLGTLEMSALGELVPTVAAFAALADHPTTITGVGHLRGHETDRLAALATQLRALGGDADDTDDGLIIRPRPLHGGRWRTYDDHRMATAGAILGLRVAGVDVENVATTEKTLPGFTGLWSTLLGEEAPA